MVPLHARPPDHRARHGGAQELDDGGAPQARGPVPAHPRHAGALLGVSEGAPGHLNAREVLSGLCASSRSPIPRIPGPRPRIDYLDAPDPEDPTRSLAPSQRLTVYEDHTRNILATNDSPDLGFGWSINPYRGCFHACAYCYARPTHEYLSFGAGTDFDRKIVVKPEAREAPPGGASTGRRGRASVIVFSGVTDCYQPLEASLPPHARVPRGLRRVPAPRRHHHQEPAHRARHRTSLLELGARRCAARDGERPVLGRGQSPRHRAVRGHAERAGSRRSSGSRRQASRSASTSHPSSRG